MASRAASKDHHTALTQATWLYVYVEEDYKVDQPVQEEAHKLAGDYREEGVYSDRKYFVRKASGGKPQVVIFWSTNLGFDSGWYMSETLGGSSLAWAMIDKDMPPLEGWLMRGALPGFHTETSLRVQAQSIIRKDVHTCEHCICLPCRSINSFGHCLAGICLAIVHGRTDGVQQLKRRPRSRNCLQGMLKEMSCQVPLSHAFEHAVDACYKAFFVHGFCYMTSYEQNITDAERDMKQAAQKAKYGGYTSPLAQEFACHEPFAQAMADWLHISTKNTANNMDWARSHPQASALSREMGCEIPIHLALEHLLDPNRNIPKAKKANKESMKEREVQFENTSKEATDSIEESQSQVQVQETIEYAPKKTVVVKSRGFGAGLAQYQEVDVEEDEELFVVPTTLKTSTVEVKHVDEVRQVDMVNVNVETQKQYSEEAEKVTTKMKQESDLHECIGGICEGICGGDKKKQVVKSRGIEITEDFAAPSALMKAEKEKELQGEIVQMREAETAREWKLREIEASYGQKFAELANSKKQLEDVILREREANSRNVYQITQLQQLDEMQKRKLQELEMAIAQHVQRRQQVEQEIAMRHQQEDQRRLQVEQEIAMRIQQEEMHKRKLQEVDMTSAQHIQRWQQLEQENAQHIQRWQQLEQELAMRQQQEEAYKRKLQEMEMANAQHAQRWQQVEQETVMRQPQEEMLRRKLQEVEMVNAQHTQRWQQHQGSADMRIKEVETFYIQKLTEVEANYRNQIEALQMEASQAGNHHQNAEQTLELSRQQHEQEKAQLIQQYEFSLSQAEQFRNELEAECRNLSQQLDKGSIEQWSEILDKQQSDRANQEHEKEKTQLRLQYEFDLDQAEQTRVELEKECKSLTSQLESSQQDASQWQKAMQESFDERYKALQDQHTEQVHQLQVQITAGTQRCVALEEKLLEIEVGGTGDDNAPAEDLATSRELAEARLVIQNLQATQIKQEDQMRLMAEELEKHHLTIQERSRSSTRKEEVIRNMEEEHMKRQMDHAEAMLKKQQAQADSQVDSVKRVHEIEASRKMIQDLQSFQVQQEGTMKGMAQAIEESRVTIQELQMDIAKKEAKVREVQDAYETRAFQHEEVSLAHNHTKAEAERLAQEIEEARALIQELHSIRSQQDQMIEDSRVTIGDLQRDTTRKEDKIRYMEETHERRKKDHETDMSNLTFTLQELQAEAARKETAIIEMEEAHAQHREQHEIEMANMHLTIQELQSGTAQYEEKVRSVQALHSEHMTMHQVEMSNMSDLLAKQSQPSDAYLRATMELCELREAMESERQNYAYHVADLEQALNAATEETNVLRGRLEMAHIQQEQWEAQIQASQVQVQTVTRSITQVQSQSIGWVTVIERFVKDSMDPESISLEVGERIEVISVKGAWAEVRTEHGKHGDVPVQCLDMEGIQARSMEGFVTPGNSAYSETHVDHDLIMETVSPQAGKITASPMMATRFQSATGLAPGSPTQQSSLPMSEHMDMTPDSTGSLMRVVRQQTPVVAEHPNVLGSPHNFSAETSHVVESGQRLIESSQRMIEQSSQRMVVMHSEQMMMVQSEPHLVGEPHPVAQEAVLPQTAPIKATRVVTTMEPPTLTTVRSGSPLQGLPQMSPLPSQPTAQPANHPARFASVAISMASSEGPAGPPPMGILSSVTDPGEFQSDSLPLQSTSQPAHLSTSAGSLGAPMPHLLAQESVSPVGLPMQPTGQPVQLASPPASQPGGSLTLPASGGSFTIQAKSAMPQMPGQPASQPAGLAVPGGSMTLPIQMMPGLPAQPKSQPVPGGSMTLPVQMIPVQPGSLNANLTPIGPAVMSSRGSGVGGANMPNN